MVRHLGSVKNELTSQVGMKIREWVGSGVIPLIEADGGSDEAAIRRAIKECKQVGPACIPITAKDKQST